MTEEQKSEAEPAKVPSIYDRVKVRFAPPDTHGFAGDWPPPEKWICEVYVDGKVREFDSGDSGMAAAVHIIERLMYDAVFDEEQKLKEAKAVIQALEGSDEGKVWG